MSSRRRQQVHAYTQFDIDRLKGVPVPPKIKCGRCQKNLPPTKYSTKQLTDLRSQIHHTGRQTAAINCQTCTGQQIVEIECTVCHKTKGLEDFARSQRSKPDDARCFKCTDDLVSHQPVNEDRYDGTRSAFVTPDSYNDYVPDYWSSADSSAGRSTIGGDDWVTVNGDQDNDGGGIALSKDFQRTMSISGSVPETLIDSEFTFAGRGQGSTPNSGSDVYTRSWHTRSTGAGSASVESSSRPHGGPLAASNSGSQYSYASTVAERSDISDVRPNGWAKIKAYRPPSPAGLIRPAGDAERESAEVWGSDGDSDEENEDDEGSDDSDGDNTII